MRRPPAERPPENEPADRGAGDAARGSAGKEVAEPEPAAQLVEAVRRLAREAVGAPAAEEKAVDSRLGGRALLALGLLALDLALLAVLFEGALDSPVAKFFKVLVPIVFGGALVAITDTMRRGLHSLAKHPATLVTAGAALLVLGLPVLLPLPVPVRTAAFATLTLDSTDLGPHPEPRRLLMVYGFRPHLLNVDEGGGRDSAATTVPLGRADLLLGAGMAALGMVRDSAPAFGLDAERMVIIRKDTLPGFLELDGEFPRLLLRSLRERSGHYVAEGRQGEHRVGIPLVGARVLEAPVPVGRHYVRLRRGDCAHDLGWQEVARAERLYLRFDTVPCLPLKD